MEKERGDKEFLLSEYEQCWAYIKFHYEQRDRSQRFFFALVTAVVGLGAALVGTDQKINFPESYIVVPIVLLVVLGLFTLLQIISLRRTTVRHHQAIVVIRKQLAGEGYQKETPLWTSLDDHGPLFFTRGFNFFTALIIIVITAALAGLAAFIPLFQWTNSGWGSLGWACLLALVVFTGQSLLYYWSLKRLDCKRA